MRISKTRTADIDRKLEEAFFWSHVNRSGDCWLWKGWLKEKGYAYFRPNRKKPGVAAHRYAYMLFNGEVPNDLEVDHTCRVRNCVNPNHLQAITHKENIRLSYIAVPADVRFASRRLTDYCKHGHKMDAANTAYYPEGQRKKCKKCSVIASTKYNKKHREK